MVFYTNPIQDVLHDSTVKRPALSFRYVVNAIRLVQMPPV